MQIESCERDGDLHLRLAGDIGIPQASRLHAELCDTCSTDAQVLIDATALESLDVSCIQLLLAASTNRPNLDIAWGTAQGVEEMLRQTGTTQLQGRESN